MSKSEISEKNSQNLPPSLGPTILKAPEELDGAEDLIELEPEALDEVEAEDVDALEASDDAEEAEAEAVEDVSEETFEEVEEALETSEAEVVDAAEKTLSLEEKAISQVSSMPSKDPWSGSSKEASYAKCGDGVTPESGVPVGEEWLTHAHFGYAPFGVHLTSPDMAQSVSFTPIPQKSSHR